MITKDMTIFQVLQVCPDSAEVFFSFGMKCLGCPVSRGETIEEAAKAHGVELEEMLDALNAVSG